MPSFIIPGNILTHTQADLEKPVSGVSASRGHFLTDCGHFLKYPQQKKLLKYPQNVEIIQINPTIMLKYPHYQ